MKRTVKSKIGFFILSGIMLLNSGMGTISQVNAESAGETAWAGETADSEEMTYEEEYIKQHLEFCESEEYQAVQETVGSLAGELALSYEEAGLNAVNKTWAQISTFAVLIGKGELDRKGTDILNLTNEYDLIVSYLMQSTSAEEAFKENYEKNYLNSMLEVLEEMKKAIGEMPSMKSNGMDLGKAEKIANRIDQILLTIQELEGVSKEDMQTCYQDALQEIKDTMDGNLLPEQKNKLIEAMWGVKALQGITEIGTATYADVLDAYLLYHAGKKTTEQWREVWQEIADSASRVNSKEANELAQSINNILSQIKESEEDMAKALAKKGIQAGTGHTIQFGIGLVSDLWDDAMKTWSLGKAVREGLVGGITVSNLLLNCDDIAYYGEMLIDTGVLAIHAWDVLKSAEFQLLSNQDFESAVKFDEAFNIYKQIQIAACDYGIGYHQALVTTPLGYIFKYSSGDNIAIATQLLAQKATWESYVCHEENENAINNGGRFVKYKRNTYYWKMNPESVEQTGLLGGFNQVPDVKNELVCRTEGGAETVILEDTGSGQIFICDDCIFYEKGYLSWGVCELDGTPIASYEKMDILDADTEHNMIICRKIEGNILGITSEGDRITLAPEEAIFWGIHGLNMYYGVRSEGMIEFFSIRIDGLDKQKIGEVRMSNPEFTMLNVGGPLVAEDGIYFTCGALGGTGIFFYGQGIYRIGYDGQIETIVDPTVAAVNFPKLYLKETEEESILYYYTGDGYSNAGSWDSWVSEDVYGVNVDDGTIQSESFVLSNIGDAIFMNGGLSTLLDESGEYTEILSAEEAAQLGYTDLGGHSGQGETFVRELDIVDDTAYFTITKITADYDLSVGWRTGYRRDVMRTYATEIGSGKFELIDEY